MKISIITVNYNNKRGLANTALSIASQTAHDIEWIIIDGGSTDGSVDIINEYKEHVTFWKSEKDNGIYNAMNKGISHATGDYVIFMNSGDTFVSCKCLEGVMKRKISADIVIGDIVLSYEDGSHYYKQSPANLSVQRLLKESVPHQSSFIKLSVLKQNGGYDESYTIISDYVFCWRMIIEKSCSYEKLPIPIAYYDVTGISGRNSVQYSNEVTRFLSNYISNSVLGTFRKQNEIPYMLAAYMTNKTQISFTMFAKHIIAGVFIFLNLVSAKYKYLRYCKFGLY